MSRIKKQVTDKKAKADESSVALIGSNVQPASFELATGETVTLGEVVGAAFEDSGLSVQEWNEQAEDVREQLIGAALAAIQQAADAEFAEKEKSGETGNNTPDEKGEGKKAGEGNEDAGAGDETPSGMVRMRGANCCVDGVSYTANADGVVDVDEAHADVLERDHGFVRT